jgi:CRP/FNR family transcriptional regulator, cyclic AMP receptor protein
MQPRHPAHPRLTAVGILADCSHDELAAVDRLSTVVDVPAGRVLMNDAAYGNEFMMLVSGELEVVVGNEIVAVLGPGEVVGEIALLIDVPRTATVRTIAASTLAVVPRAVFEQLLREAPNATRRLLRTVTTRMHATHQRALAANAYVTTIEAITPAAFTTASRDASDSAACQRHGR